MSVAAITRAPLARLLQLSALQTSHLLGGIIAISFLGRLFAAWSRATPTFFPDEYLYAELSRSIAGGSGPLIRDVASGFPSLLYPILTAPFWLFDDVDTAFRAIQALNVGVMSLAALPAFAIARQLGISRNVALLVAASALLVPDILVSGWIVAEPIAYPLVLASVWATIRSLKNPGIPGQMLLIALLALTAISRFQLVIVALAALATLLVVGVRERRVLHMLREQWLVASLVGAALALGAALLASGRLGTYSGALELSVDPLGIATWAAPTALIVAYAAGWFIVPGGLMGLLGGLARPRTREEAAASIMTVLLGFGMLAQAGFVSDTITQDIHERYVFYLSPLLAVFFAAWVDRKASWRRGYVAFAIGLGLVAALVPLSRYSAADGKTDSAFLRALGGLEELLGDIGAASAIVAAASLLACMLCLLALRGGTGSLRLLLVGALAVGIATSALAARFDHDNATRVDQRLGGASASWVDRLGVDRAVLLWTENARPAVAHETLFWNRSVDRVALLSSAKPFDNYATMRAQIDSGGHVRVDGKLLSGWALLDRSGTSLTFANGVALGDVGSLTLYRFDTPARASRRLEGQYADGWLHPNGRLTVWPAEADNFVAGRVTLTLEAPPAGPDRTIIFAAIDPGTAEAANARRTFRVAAGEARTIVLDACAPQGPWSLAYSASPASGNAERTVALRASRFSYDPTPSGRRSPACSPSSS